MKNWILLFLILGLVSCTSFQKNKFEKIQTLDISKVIIKKGLYDKFEVELKKEEVEKFIKIINSSRNIELLKAKPNFWILVKFRNGNERTFKVLENYIGEFDNYKKCNEVNYFQKIYNKGLKIELK